MGRTLQDMDDYADMASWHIVPNEFMEMCDWMYGAEKPIVYDTSRPLTTFYCNDQSPSDSGNTMVWQVTLRVQGFLGRHNFAPLGNWNGCVVDVI
jgi:hypothetical protein